jgi:ABC-2 type transport system permease protein
VLKNLKKYWFLFWKFRQLRLMTLLEYRGNFFFWTLVSVLWTIFNYFFFSLIINVNQGIAGWSVPEMYLLLSVFTVLDGFTWSFFYHNMRMYTESVFSGQLSGHLVKPVDAQFILSVQDNSYTNVLRIFIGLVMMYWSINKLVTKPSIVSLCLFALLFFVSLLFVYSIWFIVSTFSFWVEKLDNINEIVPSARRMWQIPRSVYTGIASTFLTVILPFGLISSIPSEVLVGKFSLSWTLYFITFTLVIFFCSRLFFRYSIKKYISTGG